MKYSDIPSYCDYHWFYKQIFDELPPGALVVEVGVWFGHGVAYMHHLSKESGKKIEIFAVDTFKGSDEPTHKRIVEDFGGSIFNQFNDYMMQTDSKVNPLIELSTDAAKRFEDESLDFVYLDASHDYFNVVKDIEVWLPKVKPGGVLAGHDYNSWGGVTQAVNERLPERITNKNVWWYNKIKKYDGQEY